MELNKYIQDLDVYEKPVVEECDSQCPPNEFQLDRCNLTCMCCSYLKHITNMPFGQQIEANKKILPCYYDGGNGNVDVDFCEKSVKEEINESLSDNFNWNNGKSNGNCLYQLNSDGSNTNMTATSIAVDVSPSGYLNWISPESTQYSCVSDQQSCWPWSGSLFSDGKSVTTAEMSRSASLNEIKQQSTIDLDCLWQQKISPVTVTTNLPSESIQSQLLLHKLQSKVFQKQASFGVPKTSTETTKEVSTSKLNSSKSPLFPVMQRQFSAPAKLNTGSTNSPFGYISYCDNIFNDLNRSVDYGVATSRLNSINEKCLNRKGHRSKLDKFGEHFRSYCGDDGGNISHLNSIDEEYSIQRGQGSKLDKIGEHETSSEVGSGSGGAKKKNQNTYHAAKYRDRRRQRIEKLFGEKDNLELEKNGLMKHANDINLSIIDLIRKRTLVKCTPGQQVFRCPVCSMLFGQVDDIRVHLKQKHQFHTMFNKHGRHDHLHCKPVMPNTVGSFAQDQ